MSTIHEITEDWQREGLSPTWVKLQAAQAEFDALAADAARYRWLRERMIGVDFDWAENGITALAFEMPDGCSFGGSCDQNIDAAMKGE